MKAAPHVAHQAASAASQAASNVASHAARHATRYAWLLVALLWVVAMLNYLDRQVIFSLFPPLQREFGVSNVQLGLISTVFLWVYGALSPVGGFLADRFSRKRVILFSLAVWSLVTWATAHVTSFNQLLWARALMGVSEACYLPAALALIADYHGERTRSRATGLHQSGLYGGIILGGVIGGWMGEHYGWRAAFTALGVIGVGYAALLVFTLKDSATAAVAPATDQRAADELAADKHANAERANAERAARPQFLPALKELITLPGFLLLGTVSSMAAVAFWIVYTWLPTYLYERFHLSLTGAGFSATFYIQAASFGGILFGGWLADSWSRTNPRARVLIVAAGFVAAGIFLFLVGQTSSYAVLVLSLIIFGLGRGFFDCNLMPVLCRIAPPQLRATGYGLFNLASCVVGGAMAAAAGALKDSLGLGGALQISALILGAAGLLLLPLKLPALAAKASGVK